MLRRASALLIASTLVILLGATGADAARHRAASPTVPSYRSLGASGRTYAYPRVRQIDGKSLWDLGKQKGRWPQVP